MSQFLGVSWTDATRIAVLGAVLGGFFSIFKEVFAAGLQWLFRRGDEQRGRRALYGRLAQHYFQMGVGAWKALAAWKNATGDIAGAKECGIPQRRIVRDVGADGAVVWYLTDTRRNLEHIRDELLGEFVDRDPGLR